MSNFDAAHFAVSGFPQASETISFGLVDNLIGFEFVQGPLSATTQIIIGDISTISELCHRIADTINAATDVNQGWSASVSGSNVNLTPPSGDAGSMGVESAASNISVGYDSPNPDGIIIHGIS